MANPNPTGQGTAKCLTTNDQDEREQLAVLRQVLGLYPAALTQDELIRELTGGRSRQFSDRDAVARAVRDLAASGLLHRPGEDEVVRPTRAAVRCFELSEVGF
ncbi:MAG TPA: hypothetical protein VFJ61_04880 [Solirubrobacterales bacterium]|nr:hypothetical protein [Solirubrobacterales bacterium]